MIRLIIAGLVLAVALAVTAVTHATYAGASAVAVSAVAPLEAALVSLLTGVGIEAGPAFSAVLLYRLATYWLHVAPGWLPWRVLQRREYV